MFSEDSDIRDDSAADAPQTQQPDESTPIEEAPAEAVCDPADEPAPEAPSPEPDHAMPTDVASDTGGSGIVSYPSSGASSEAVPDTEVPHEEAAFHTEAGDVMDASSASSDGIEGEPVLIEPPAGEIAPREGEAAFAAEVQNEAGTDITEIFDHIGGQGTLAAEDAAGSETGVETEANGEPTGNDAVADAAITAALDAPDGPDVDTTVVVDDIDGGAAVAGAPAAAEAATEAVQVSASGLEPLRIRQLVEGALFAAPGPLSAAKLAALATGLTAAEVRSAVSELNKLYRANGHALKIEEIAGGFRILTDRDLGEPLGTFFARRSKDRLSRAALETLAIVAYKQPATRATIETIRGVASDSVVTNLIELGLVRISGQAEAPGRPTLYSTTKRFLDHFGLKSLRDLPREKDFDSMEKA